MIKDYLKLLRVKHYLKNLLVFAPLFFSMKFFNSEYLIKNIIGFIIFSLVSSIVYIINDINDIEKDRNHPEKKNRPLASGRVKKHVALIVAILLFTLSILLGALIKSSVYSYLAVYGYLIVNVAYSVKLKNIPIVDVSIIVIGFILRTIYGGLIVDVVISNWLILTVISFSYYLALGKRRNELTSNGNKSRGVLEFYNSEFLDKMMYVMLTLFIVFYSLWTMSISSNASILIWSVLWVIIIVMRYSLIIEGNSYGDPADVLLSDWILISLSLLYGIFMFLTLYFIL